MNLNTKKNVDCGLGIPPLFFYLSICFFFFSLVYLSINYFIYFYLFIFFFSAGPNEVSDRRPTTHSFNCFFISFD